MLSLYSFVFLVLITFSYLQTLPDRIDFDLYSSVYSANNLKVSNVTTPDSMQKVFLEPKLVVDDYDTNICTLAEHIKKKEEFQRKFLEKNEKNTTSNSTVTSITQKLYPNIVYSWPYVHRNNSYQQPLKPSIKSINNLDAEPPKNETLEVLNFNRIMFTFNGSQTIEISKIHLNITNNLKIEVISPEPNRPATLINIRVGVLFCLLICVVLYVAWFQSNSTKYKHHIVSTRDSDILGYKEHHYEDNTIIASEMQKKIMCDVLFEQIDERPNNRKKAITVSDYEDNTIIASDMQKKIMYDVVFEQIDERPKNRKKSITVSDLL